MTTINPKYKIGDVIKRDTYWKIINIQILNSGRGWWYVTVKCSKNGKEFSKIKRFGGSWLDDMNFKVIGNFQCREKAIKSKTAPLKIRISTLKAKIHELTKELTEKEIELNNLEKKELSL